MAGAMSGKSKMGMSLARKGDPTIMATGRPAQAGAKPMTTNKGAKFAGGAMKRAGNNMVYGTGRPGAAGQAPVTC